MAIRREGTSAVREIEMNKSRDGETKAMGTFTLTPVVIDTDAKGREVKTMRISAGEPKIREARAGSVHAGLVVESVEWSVLEKGVQFGGDLWVEKMRRSRSVRPALGGKRDNTSITKNFDSALSYALDIGSLEAMKQER